MIRTHSLLESALFWLRGEGSVVFYEYGPCDKMTSTVVSRRESSLVVFFDRPELADSPEHEREACIPNTRWQTIPCLKGGKRTQEPCRPSIRSAAMPSSYADIWMQRLRCSSRQTSVCMSWTRMVSLNAIA